MYISVQILCTKRYCQTLNVKGKLTMYKIKKIKEKLLYNSLSVKNTYFKHDIDELKSRVDENGIILCDEEWLSKASYYMLEQAKRKLSVDIASNIEEKNLLILNSYARDMCIQKYADSKVFDFSHILVFPNPYEITPLSALAVFSTKENCIVKSIVKGKDGLDVEAESSYGKNHRIAIMGMYPDFDNTVELQLLDKNQNIIAVKSFNIKTDKLPKKLIDMVVCKKKSKPSIYRLTFITGGSELHLPIAFDENGDIRYYINKSPKSYGVYPIDNGEFLFCEDKVRVPTFGNSHGILTYSMDFLGRASKAHFSERGFHHDVFVMPDTKNFLTISNSFKNATEDTVCEIDRHTGEVVKELNMIDVFGEKYFDKADWSHLNTVSYDKEENCIYVCMRNIHSAAKIDWSSMELKWVLCHKDFWEGTKIQDKVLRPVGEIGKDFHYFFQAHAFYKKEDIDENRARFYIYDNHWHMRRQVPFFEKSKYSYINVYIIDSFNNTVELEKRYVVPKSRIRSNAVFEDASHVVMAMNATTGDPSDEYSSGSIMQLDIDTGEVINEYYVDRGFYRAYEFRPDYKKMELALTDMEDYIYGDLIPPHVSDINPQKIAYKKQKINEKEIYLSEDKLFCTTVDHLLQKVYFVGINSVYVKDFDISVQTMPEKFSKQKFFVCIDISKLPKDKYQIYYLYEQQYIDTGKYINISVAN